MLQVFAGRLCYHREIGAALQAGLHNLTVLKAVEFQYVNTLIGAVDRGLEREL
jgi:hypothetical protein